MGMAQTQGQIVLYYILQRSLLSQAVAKHAVNKLIRPLAAEFFRKVHAFIAGSGNRDPFHIKNLVQAQLQYTIHRRVQLLQRARCQLLNQKIQRPFCLHRTVDQFRSKTAILFFQIRLPQDTVQRNGGIRFIIPDLHQDMQCRFPSVQRLFQFHLRYRITLRHWHPPVNLRLIIGWLLLPYRY